MRRPRSIRLAGMLHALAAVAALHLTVGMAAAQGRLEPRLRPQAGDWNVARLRAEVDVRIDGRVAHVEVREWFRNDGGPFGEADYIHPLPAGAVFGSYTLFAGDTELSGETLDAEEARRIYEQIVRAQRDPALIEMLGNGMLRARVFPFEAGEVRRITMRYTQLLEQGGDALQFRYVGSRPGRGRGEAADSVPVRLRIIVDDCDAYRDAYSPTHGLDVRREDGRMIVEPRGAVGGAFTMLLPPARRGVGVSLVAHRPAVGEDGYFMLMLSPDAVQAERIPRDLTAIVDVSGSMSGEKMEQARRALTQLLGTLDDGDRFRLIAFSSAVTAYRAEWTHATRAERAEAARWVDGLRAVGGTNIAGALDEAFAVAPGADRLPVVIFLTDGMPTVGETSAERISERAANMRGDARIFAFGVGYDVNTQLLDALSEAARGSTQYVGPDDDVELAVSALAARISHPVLANLRIDGAPVRLREIHPTRLPDLFAGEELVIFGRYAAMRSDVTGELAIAGERVGSGAALRERYAASVTFPAHSLANDFVPRLWASRKLGELARQIRLNGEDAELVDELRATALRYGLLSEYTSYLVLEPGADPRPHAGALRRSNALVSGATAVAAADAARQSREVRSVAEVEAAQRAVVLASPAAADRAGGAVAGGPDGRHAGARLVAGRHFRLTDGVWRDAGVDAQHRVVAVEPLSDAWFALLGALPELRSIFAEFEQVDVAGAAVTIRVAPGGSPTMTPAVIEQTRRAFRAPDRSGARDAQSPGR